jgi:hypothetical protein
MTTTDPQFATLLRFRKFMYDAEMCRLNAIACMGTLIDARVYRRRQGVFTSLAKRVARTEPRIYDLYPELKEV